MIFIHIQTLFQALAKSNLPLRIVELQHFPFCEAFEELLKAKGHGLQELLFRAINSLNSKHILFIGKHCKALQRLHIKELGPEEDTTMSLMTHSMYFYSKSLLLRYSLDPIIQAARLTIFHIVFRSDGP